ncbi:MAG: NAD(P)-binding domain-containing protein [Hyphomicrobiaceae bacterium]|nr:NAD(P)-binding domain-containing protein [Hyphomicrobiaceae bacterium]
MKSITTVIIGAGQCGLAMSRHLRDRSIDHVLLERGSIANSWSTERWDSLRLLTPNWQSRLPGWCYGGDDPDGYMTMPEVVRYLAGYADDIGAPVEEATEVVGVRRDEAGYVVATSRGSWHCRTLVLASGACSRPVVPRIAEELPRSLHTTTPSRYRSPACLPSGRVLVVGASASGMQVAREIQASGRQVILAVGGHVRLPRSYRGRDIMWWLDAIGAMDERYDQLDDLDRARGLPSMQLIGTPERVTVDLNALRRSGVEIVGRLVGVRDGQAQFSGALPNICALADLKMNRLLDRIDAWVTSMGIGGDIGPPCRYEPTDVGPRPRLHAELGPSGIRSVIWATGYAPNLSWLDLPVFDRKGRLIHDGGVVAPGLYVIGQPFMRRRKSTLIDGAADDAADLAAHLHSHIAQAAA